MSALSSYRSALAAVAVAAFYAALVLVAAGDSASADLRALWMAAEALADGRPELVYARDAGPFTMLPPPEWVAVLKAEGVHGQVFPYLYPPLWARLTSWLTPWIGFDDFLSAARLVNVALVLGMLALARRLAAPGVSLAVYWLIGVVLLLGTTVGLVPVYQNQPQILVAFLTLLAIHAAERGRPARAGLWLALAAALKLLPAVFALFWIAGGRGRAAAFAAGFAAALGLASLALSGWPLHQDFLRVLASVGDTTLVVRLSYSVESIAAALAWPDALILVTEPLPDPAGPALGWHVLARPPALAALSLALTVTALSVAVLMFRRHGQGPDRAFLWPFAITLVSMTAPLAWSYYYLAPLAFAPALLARAGWPLRMAVVLALGLGLSPAAALLADLLPGAGSGRADASLQIAGLSALAVYAAACLAVATGHARDRALKISIQCLP